MASSFFDALKRRQSFANPHVRLVLSPERRFVTASLCAHWCGDPYFLR